MKKDSIPDELYENAIEWYTGAKTATICVTHKKYITRIKALAKANPEIKIIAEPEKNGGCLVAHIPLKCISIRSPKGKELTEEQRTAMAERLEKARKAKK